MSAAGPIRWHYTVVTKLRQAVHEGVLRPVAVGPAPQEKPAVWFSTNLRRFKLELSDPTLAVTDMTRATIPPDFRDPRAHHAFRIARA